MTPSSIATLRPAGVPLHSRLGNIETSLNEGGNYPEEDVDSTSSGGYGDGGADVWSRRSQRGINSNSASDEVKAKELPSHVREGDGNQGTGGSAFGKAGSQGTPSSSTRQWRSTGSGGGDMGLIEQSLGGTNLKNEMQDAMQGRDGGWPTATGETS